MLHDTQIVAPKDLATLESGDIYLPAPDDSAWWDAYADWLRYLKGEKRESTVRDYKSRCAIFWRWCEAQGVPLGGVGRVNLRHFLSERVGAGVGDRTRRSDVRVIRSFFEWCEEEGHIRENRLAGYKLPRASRPFVPVPTDEQVRALFAASERRWEGDDRCLRFYSKKLRRYYKRRNPAILRGLVATAARPNEIAGLLSQDVDRQAMKVTFRRTKTGVPRTVKLSAAWLPWIDAYLLVRPRSDKPQLFVNCYGGAMDTDLISKSFREDMDFAGMTKLFTLYGLRHYSITHMAEGNPLVAKEMAGHESLKTTQGYVHTREKFLEENYAKHDPLAALEGERRALPTRGKKLVR